MAADTKNKILDTAEYLFAENGIKNTSLRMITQEAEVNLASVNYHFGSKDELVAQIFVRRLKPMNEERLARLQEILQGCGDGRSPDLRQVVCAFIAPPLEMSRDGTNHGAVFIRLLGRTYTEPDETIHSLIRSTHRAVIDAFKPVFEQCLPELAKQELNWRLHFMVGSLAYAMSGSDTMRLISSGTVDEQASIRDLGSRLADFLVAGLSAPPGLVSDSTSQIGN